MEQLTTKQIIDETVEYYKTHARGMNEQRSCEYKTDEGHMCAVGRCLTDDGHAQISYQNSLVEDIINLDTLLKPQYKGYDLAFWQNLQRLHDDDNYWEEIGDKNILSVEGEEYLLDLRQNHE